MNAEGFCPLEDDLQKHLKQPIRALEMSDTSGQTRWPR